MDILCESGLLQTRGFVPGPWEEGSLGWMSLGDVGGIVGVWRNGKGDLGCFGVMQVGLGSAWGWQVARWLNLGGFPGGWSCLCYWCLRPLLSGPQTHPIYLHLCLWDAPLQFHWGQSLYSDFGLAEETPFRHPVPFLALCL